MKFSFTSKKAFDRVNHSILLKKGKHYGIRCVARAWFCSYLCYRKQYLSVNGLNPIWTRGDGIPPLRFFFRNSKTPGDIKKKLSDVNFMPLMDILPILSITIVVRCCHSFFFLQTLFPVCHVIFWVEKTKKLDLFSR